MRRLTRRLRRPDDERGITMILLAVSLVVIMAMAALVIDVGAMEHERRELQNGADAAALSIAHSCALSQPACASPTADATSLAGLNAVDGASAVDSAAVDPVAHRVTVRTSTRSKGGVPLLPFNFSQGGTTLHATSVATWGAPAHANTLPLTLSRCEFDKVAFGATTVIFHTGERGVTDCSNGPAGADIPGGFGWLDPSSPGTCSAGIDAGGSVSVDPGLPAPSGCNLTSLLGKTLLVPIFDNATKTGTKATYHIVGYGAFVLTGYRFPSTSAGTPPPCKAPDTCIGGTFTEFVIDAGTIGGTDFGVAVVKLVQ